MWEKGKPTEPGLYAVRCGPFEQTLVDVKPQFVFEERFLWYFMFGTELKFSVNYEWRWDEYKKVNLEELFG